MKKLFLYTILLISFSACKPGIPDDIIKPDQMTKILMDIHIIDGYVTTIPTQDSARKVSAAYYKGIYKKFDTDSAGFNRSLDYYYKHPDMMHEIYKTVVADLQKINDLPGKDIPLQTLKK